MTQPRFFRHRALARDRPAAYHGYMGQTAAPRPRPFSGPTGRLVLEHRQEIQEILDRHGLRRAELFGSVARGDDTANSDIDLLVDYPSGIGLFTIARIQAELEQILGVDVDLVPRAGLKPAVRAVIQDELIPL